MVNGQSNVICLTIPGRPVPKQRPRLGYSGRRAYVYTPTETREYEDRVRAAALVAGITPLKGPLVMEAHLWLYGRRGDGDNYWKSLADALTGIAYEDDSQIIDWRLRIHQARRRDAERAEIEIRRAEVESA